MDATLAADEEFELYDQPEYTLEEPQVSDPEPEPEPEPELDLSFLSETSETERHTVEPGPEHETGQPAPEAPQSFIREIPGGAGHGVARAYGYIAVACAFGATARLTRGGTRSTSRNPLQVTVECDAETFSRIGKLYDRIAPAAERAAAEARAAARAAGRDFFNSYAVNLLTRAVLSGFPLGAASAVVPPGTTNPAPLREATRVRLLDEEAHRAAVIAGREWAKEALALVPVAA